MKKINKTSTARGSKKKAKLRPGVKDKAKQARRAAPAQKKPPGTKRPGKKRGPKPGTNLRFNWAGVNWGLRDAEIARRLGVSRERVRQVRKEKGLAPSPGIGRSSRNRKPQRAGKARRLRVAKPVGPPVVLRAYGWDEAKWR